MSGSWRPPNRSTPSDGEGRKLVRVDVARARRHLARGDPRPQLGRSVPHIRFDALRERRLTLRLCGSAGRSVEDVSCLEHAVHDDRKLSGDRHCSALEAQPLTQLRG